MSVSSNSKSHTKNCYSSGKHQLRRSQFDIWTLVSCFKSPLWDNTHSVTVSTNRRSR